MHRSEHWVVVSGCATVCRDDEMFVLESNESIFIKAKQIHRLANETDKPLIVIEVQTGIYLGEDDIIRYDDVYQRSVSWEALVFLKIISRDLYLLDQIAGSK